MSVFKTAWNEYYRCIVYTQYKIPVHKTNITRNTYLSALHSHAHTHTKTPYRIGIAVGLVVLPI